MRTLTIHRKKSFVGCLMKDQVYIRDADAGELTIEGVIEAMKKIIAADLAKK